MHSFHDLLVLMVVIWTAGKIFRSLRLPVVFGELLGGILVGPELFNLVDPSSHTIEVLAELGIFFLMLHTGIHTDHEELFAASKKAILVALGGTIIPFILGFITAFWFGYSLAVSLFVGVALSTSAIALAARVLKDSKLIDTPAGKVTLGACIVNDIAALIAFSIVLNYASSGSTSLQQIVIMLGKVSLFFAVVLYAGVRWSKFLDRIICFGNKGFTATLILALLLGIAAEWIGLHHIIGAFLAGLFISSRHIETRTLEKIEDRIYGLSYSFLGPIFFASLAFYLDFSSIFTMPVFLTILLTMAILGKILGAGGSAWLAGMKKEEAGVIGIVMNNRGAVKLIIASIGLQQGIIDESVFSILVTVAFATTMLSILATDPIARRLNVLKPS